MKVSIGFHFIEHNDQTSVSILNALNKAGITVDGNALELVYKTDDGGDLVRVWTEATLPAYFAAADLLFAINRGGPVMFIASELTEQQFDTLEAVALSQKIDFDDGAAVDLEFFGYCERANHIQLLIAHLS